MEGPSLAPAETDTYKIVSVIRWLLARVMGGREVLSAARTYYVDTSLGADTNTGLFAGAGGAKATIQAAVNAALSVDGQTFGITIQVAAGTYSESVVVNGPFQTSGTVSLTGDTVTPGNVIISGSLTVQNNATLTVGGFRINSTAFCLSSLTNGTVNLTGKMLWGTASVHMYADGGKINLYADYSVVASATAIIHAESAFFGSIRAQQALKATFDSNAFTNTLYCSTKSFMYLANVTFVTGASTSSGNVYHVDSLSILNCGGRDPNVIPGTFRFDDSSFGGIFI